MFRAALFIVGCVVLAGCQDGSKRKESRHGAEEVLASQMIGQVPRWMRVERLPKRAHPGARVFATSGCTTCHTYLGSGTRNLRGRDLSSIGRRHRARFFERYVTNPGGFGDDVMPPFAALGRRNIRSLAIFLASSEGPR